MNNTQNNKPDKKNYTPKKRKKEITLKEAIILEIKDRIKNFRLSFSIDSEFLIKSGICALLIIVFSCLQTTFFVRFAPFGAVPDLMLIFVVALAVYENERWGGIVGLICAFVINSLGSLNTVTLLPVLYSMCGYFIGILSLNYFTNSFAVKSIYVGSACFVKAIVSAISAAYLTDARFSQILGDIVIPEFFSTLLISPLIFFITWISFKKFHKSRAERIGM